MHLPTLRQLQFLDALAREGSFSRAADQCSVTQPTLSAGIKELESLLQIQLVEREARGASLTAAGVEIVTRARKVLSDMQDLVSAAHEASQPLSSIFRLGAIPTVAPYVLPKILPQLRTEYPELKLYLREDITERLLEDVRARRLDAALIALPWEADGIETITLADDEFLLATPQGHPLSALTTLSPDDLGDADILLLEDGHCLRDHALSVCKLQNRPREAEVAATSLQTLVHMVSGGLGVSLVPRLAADAGVAAGTDLELQSFTTPLIGRQIGIAWRQGSPRKADVTIIGDIVRGAL